MGLFSDKLQNLEVETHNVIYLLVDKHGKYHEENEFDYIAIKLPENLQYNLSEGYDSSYALFITYDQIISNDFQLYSFGTLSHEQFFEIVDGLIEKYGLDLD